MRENLYELNNTIEYYAMSIDRDIRLEPATCGIGRLLLE